MAKKINTKYYISEEQQKKKIIDIINYICKKDCNKYINDDALKEILEDYCDNPEILYLSNKDLLLEALCKYTILNINALTDAKLDYNFQINELKEIIEEKEIKMQKLKKERKNMVSTIYRLKHKKHKIH